jgi:hypothetical protein
LHDAGWDGDGEATGAAVRVGKGDVPAAAVVGLLDGEGDPGFGVSAGYAAAEAAAEAARSAARRWYSHSTSPCRVTHPLDTVTSSFSIGTCASHSNARVTAAATSASVRSAALGNRTSTSLATATTPRTRCAAHFFR